ncbi:MAG: hypothetical protein H7249_17260 [Chitinophagaceae bacterium]|nr:hypothetical protein [Oligoflexus sp.]
MSIRPKTRALQIHSFLKLLVFSHCFSATVAACPGLLLGQHLPFNDRKLITRDHLALYNRDTNGWHPMPLEVDPLDPEGNLMFPKDTKWAKEGLTPSDRLSFPIDRFAQRFDPKAPHPDLPCGAKDVIELTYQGRYAYLLDCEQDKQILEPRPVSYDVSKRTVRTNDYLYRYTESNHLVFESIQVASRGGKGMISVAKDSDLMIIGDVKNFFTLYFDSSDIDAEIIHKRQGTMGLMGGMEFFLRILAFRIDMELLPEVNFFEDSLFMPMSMTLPVNAKKYLRRGSGIYYSWAPEKDVVWDWNASRLEDLDFAQLDPDGKGPLTKPSSRFCESRFCLYTIVGKAKDRPFVMNFKIARKAADLGFFPQLILDVPAVEKKLGHKLGRYSPEGRIAIYFETARLPKGTHTWDFWIYFPDKNADEQCTFRIKRENISHLLPRPKP